MKIPAVARDKINIAKKLFCLFTDYPPDGRAPPLNSKGQIYREMKRGLISAFILWHLNARVILSQ